MRASTLAVILVSIGLSASGAWAQAAEEQRTLIAQNNRELKAVAPKITGQAPYRFRIKTSSERIPREAWEDLAKAHGGFAVDHRPGKGEAYFGLPNTGLLRVSSDMTRIDVLKAAPELRDGGTMHNATIWYDERGEAFLAFPGVDRAAIFTTDLEGNLVHKLPAPTLDQISVEPVKKYFAEKGAFVPTDVDYLDGLYYITTGYSPLDFVLTAKVNSTNPFDAAWNALAFGGKGEADGQFMTGHGVTVYPDKRHIVVADRPKSRLQRFTPEGAFVDQLRLPAGTLPCDVDYLGEYTLVPCLEGANKELGAPIYLLRGTEIVSTIMCREDLGLSRFSHVHNAVLREVNGQLFIIAQAWNPGDFVVLQQVVD